MMKHTKPPCGDGRFISLEGIEGAGKTTIMRFICEKLSAHGISYVVTREPGGTAIAEAIRAVLLNHYDESMCADTELLLMFAGRAQNIAQVVLPALQRGQWVLSDRFTDASFAYQGGGRGIDAAHISELAHWAQRNLQPDLTILLDIPTSIGLSRVTSRGAKDRIEMEGAEFFARVRQSYLQLAQQHAQRFRIVNANQPLPQVRQQVLTLIEALLVKNP